MDDSDETSSGPESVSSSEFVEKPDRLTNKTEPKKGVPSLDEWQDFFSRIVVSALINAYLAFALGDFFEDLTPMEMQQITLSKEDLAQISMPLAATANQIPFMKRHGRTIITFGDSYESLLMLFLWMRRVNRIARKHGKKRRERVVRSRPVRQSNGVNQNANDAGDSATEGGAASVNGYGIYNPGSG